jgi:hypothetical protein
MSDLGPLHYFLGIEVTSTSDGIYLPQEKYIHDILSCVALTYHSNVDTPMELDVHLCPTNGGSLDDPTCYRHLVGSPVYLRITRPECKIICYSLVLFACCRLGLAAGQPCCPLAGAVAGMAIGHLVQGCTSGI